MSEERKTTRRKQTAAKSEEAATEAPTRITSANRKPLAPILEEGHVVVV